jgi:branched-chain amino acid aminotransferase
MRAWVNGHLLDTADAPALSVLDHGLTVGDGAFETIKTVAGQPFALSRHLRRMATSLTGLGIDPPSESVLREGVEAVLTADDLAGDGRLRLTVTGGRSPLGSERGDEGPTVVVVSDDLGEWPATTAAATVPWPRNERGALAGLKTTSYAENVIALAHAHERGASEAVFENLRGQLCEGTGSNVFVVVDGELITPTLSSGCLAGITRELVLEWCEVSERDLPLDVLQEADEVFLASTTRDVQGLHRIDERELDAPGPVTAQTAKVFAQRSQENVDP